MPADVDFDAPGLQPARGLGYGLMASSFLLPHACCRRRSLFLDLQKTSSSHIFFFQTRREKILDTNPYYVETQNNVLIMSNWGGRESLGQIARRKMEVSGSF